MKFEMSLLKTITRSLIFDILEGAQEFTTVGLLGSRQSGKTTLSRLIFKDHAYVSLKDIEMRTAATIDPRAFLNANKNDSGLIIDDFQYVPELLSYMQPRGDGDHTPGTFVVCGPQSSVTKELLTGYLEEDISLHTLLPLSLKELTHNYALESTLDALLHKGLHPAAYATEHDAHEIYRNFLSTYINNDIKEGQVDSVTTFHTFLKECAAQVGQVLNITTLAQLAGISDHTARRWLSILEDHLIIFLIKPYHTSFGKRLIKSPKLYFFDPGVICSLLNITQDDISTHPLKKKLFETLLMSELAKLAQPDQLYFWKDKTSHEIECLLKKGGQVIPLKIGHTQTAIKDFAYWHKVSDTETPGYHITQSAYLEDTHTNLTWKYLKPLYTFLN